MADMTDKLLGPLAVRILGWLGAALAGVLLTLMLNSSGQNQRVDSNQHRIEQLETTMKELQANYATNKRVDDVQAEVRANFRDLSGKMDNVIKILLENRNR